MSYRLHITYAILFLPLILVSQAKYINQANAALKQGDAEQAETLYAKAESDCKDTAPLTNNRAVLSALDGDVDGALAQMDSNHLDLPIHDYNRALLHLNLKEHDAAWDWLSRLEDRGLSKGTKERNHLRDLNRKTADLKLRAFVVRARSIMDAGADKEAMAVVDEALVLRPADAGLNFMKAELAMRIPDPFSALTALDAIPDAALTRDQHTEVQLLRAHALGRINKMREATRLLEKLLFVQKVKDARLNEMLAYFYYRMGRYDKAVDAIKSAYTASANALLIAANAATYSGKHRQAFSMYEAAHAASEVNSPDILLGMALSLVHLDREKQAMQLIDSLASNYPDNHNVMNAQGIIYKDVGLQYKNGFHASKAKPYFRKSMAAFQAAAVANPRMEQAYLGNKALTLFFQGMDQAAIRILDSHDRLSSQNNRALIDVSQSRYRSAHHRLDSLATAYYRLHKKKHPVLEQNRMKSRQRAELSKNYKFITSFILHQDRPHPSYDNPFSDSPVTEMETLTFDDFMLEYSDEVCKAKAERSKRKSNRKKRVKLFKRKNKKYKGQCPEF